MLKNIILKVHYSESGVVVTRGKKKEKFEGRQHEDRLPLAAIGIRNLQERKSKLRRRLFLVDIREGKLKGYFFQRRRITSFLRKELTKSANN